MFKLFKFGTFKRSRTSNPTSKLAFLSAPPKGVTMQIAATATFTAKLIIEGEGHVITVGAGSRIRGSIRIKGRNNRVTIGEDVECSDQIVIQGRENKIAIGDKVALGGRIMMKGVGQLVDIGNGTVARDTYILCSEEKNVIIGKGCLFSRNVEIRTTDAHALINRETGERLNLAQSVEIGDHVWMGVGVLVSKGAKIAEDNVVGAKSFVAKPFLESGTVIAGLPAQVVKRGVTWQRDRKAKYDPDTLENWRLL
ncbi:hypothetical protein [Shinella sp.]|jgi:carbonic anhydrase/acetyltransferase-like protein (isoleucine patch superfamily)|uniref:acyltransferase n=1 Tax=Shinella sp. TaxID=1870904 RepID=UPI0029B6B127|nr:hypothetical protein [Shinella sp.]MDX3972871.1 hypothetical protein [Shinella sp.]